MKSRTWEWEVRSMKEENPFIIHTEDDSALQAMKKFEATWGEKSIYSLRKTAEIIRYEETK